MREFLAAGRAAGQGAGRAGPRGPAAGGQRGHDRHAAQRAAVLHPREPQTGEARRVAARGERGLDPGDRPAARPGALHRTHGVQRDEALSEERPGELPAVHRRAVRRRPQRVHRIRRDRLHPARAHRHAAHRGQGVRDPQRLGARAAVRFVRGGRRARRGARRVARAQGRRGPDDAEVAADRVQGVALRGCGSRSATSTAS